jgi:excinuclease UvrABC ATPase subunit
MSYEVKVLDEKVIKLLLYLEELQLIQFIKKASTENKTPIKKSFNGLISKEQGEDLHRQLKEMRNEWERI